MILFPEKKDGHHLHVSSVKQRDSDEHGVMFTFALQIPSSPPSELAKRMSQFYKKYFEEDGAETAINAILSQDGE